MTTLKDRIIELLIKNKLLTEENLNSALQFQKEKGGRLSDILVRLGYVKDEDLISSLSQEFSIPTMSLSKFKIDPEVTKLISPEVARLYQIVPVSKIGDTLTIAMVDPLNILAIDEIKSLTGFKINPIVTARKEIEGTIDQYYGEPTQKAIEELMKGIDESQIELIKGEAKAILDSKELMRLTQEAPVVKFTNALLSEGIRLRASDILIEPLEKTLRIRYRIDGVLRDTEAPGKYMHDPIVSRIKVMSELDIAEHRLPQDGRFKIKLESREVDFRVSILPSSFGEKVALRILDKLVATLDIDKLGFDLKGLADLKKAALKPHGMILVCGPTGSGKTTTLYSILKYVDSPQKNIITVEDPVEYQLEGINQVTVHPDIGLTFASSLRSILRQDPNVIMIGEIRDYDTVDIAIKAALTGHLVLSTLHTTTACGSIVRLLNMGVEPFLMTSSLIAIVAQRLVRKICTRCKEPYEVSGSLIERLKVPRPSGQKLIFYRGKGCRDCLNTGYSGRIGIAEVLSLTPSIKDLILSRAQEYLLKDAARKEGMKTLREDGLSKVSAGITTLEEVLKTTAPDE
jgi:type IV pilus assembly protein PilB